MEQALIEIRRAVELEPLELFYNAFWGYVLHVTRQFDLAIAQLKHAISLDPTLWFPHWFLSITHALNGQLDEAVATADRANELSGRNALAIGLLGRAYGLSGRTTEARQLLRELEVRHRFGYVPPSSMAMIHRGLGNLEDALKWWTRAVQGHDLLIATSLRSEPGYDPLRSHPRYKTLLRKMNLEA